MGRKQTDEGEDSRSLGGGIFGVTRVKNLKLGLDLSNNYWNYQLMITKLLDRL